MGNSAAHADQRVPQGQQELDAGVPGGTELGAYLETRDGSADTGGGRRTRQLEWLHGRIRQAAPWTLALPS